MGTGQEQSLKLKTSENAKDWTERRGCSFLGVDELLSRRIMSCRIGDVGRAVLDDDDDWMVVVRALDMLNVSNPSYHMPKESKFEFEPYAGLERTQTWLGILGLKAKFKRR